MNDSGDYGLTVQPVAVNRILTTGQVTALAAGRTVGGDDKIFGEDGDDVILGGVGNDTINGLTGDNIMLGDNGIVGYLSTGEVSTIVSTDTSFGGADQINATTGNDLVLGGFGSDSVAVGDGRNVVVGDNGRMTFTLGVLTTVENTVTTVGGNDKVVTGGKDDIILGGFGIDTINAGAGNNVVLGDNGIVTFDAAGAVNDIKVLSATIGGNDEITALNGNDIVIGGAGADTIDAGAGANIVFGDNGAVAWVNGLISSLTTTDPSVGGNDRVVTTTGADIIFGGFGNDILTGGAGDNIVVGDSGNLSFTKAGDLSQVRTTDITLGGNDSITTLGGRDALLGGAGADKINGGDGANVIIGDGGRVAFSLGAFSSATSLDTLVGGADTINGGADDDSIIGGLGTDEISGGDGNNLVFGDNGSLLFVSGKRFKAETLEPRVGDADIINTGSGLDLVFGGNGRDVISLGAGNDIALGDNGNGRYHPNGAVLFVTTSDFLFGADDVILGGDGDDVLIGGTGNDAIDGGLNKDLIFGDNVGLDRSTTLGEKTNVRFRVLEGTQLYSTDDGGAGKLLVTGDAQIDPRGTAGWNDFAISMLNMSGDIITAPSDDYLAGGADDDMIFGQSGNDTIQGDGSVDIKLTNNLLVRALRDGNNELAINPSFDAETDGHDYIEGNAGNDTIFGNQGQDDIVGGSSDLFSLITPTMRTDGFDMIFGGSGLAIARNHEGPAGDAGHAADSDMILGDNGDIFRIVGVEGVPGKFVTFNYDNYDPANPIVVRGIHMLDYTPGGFDFDAVLAKDDRGAADEIHGEAGDDFIFGQVGNDVLFGDAQNDSIVAGYGADWISGGTGEDGILGDDGLIFASRNGTEKGEPLYGIAPVDPGQLNQLIKDDKGGLVGVINVEKALKYTADLTPDNLDPGDKPNPLFRPFYANDIIFGGLGNDSIHAGAGDDAVSGAEASVFSVVTSYNSIGLLNGSVIRSDFTRPFNPGNPLGYGLETNRFALFNANDPLRKVMLTLQGQLNDKGNGLEWILNFDAAEGPKDQFWVQGTEYQPLPTDGDDRIFGDLGNDWIVGGTGRDSMYGGWGDDLINADDDLSTNGGLNDKADTNPSYEDLSYGGAGRDILIGNTAGDRLVDWEGPNNAYLLPFAGATSPTIIDKYDPTVASFLLDLSESQGADLSLAQHYGTDPARNGEPMGELGMVIEGDDAWGAQLGNIGIGQPPVQQPEPDVKESAGTQPIWQIAAASAIGGDGTVIATADLAPIVDQARKLWEEALGEGDGRLAVLNTISVAVGNLPADALGVTLGGSILIDRDAGGWGWFADDTPADNAEFGADFGAGALAATPGGAADGRMDLLSTVLHEMGNAMGLPETLNQDVSGMYLAAGIRTLPPTRNGDDGQSAPTINWTSSYGGQAPSGGTTPGWLGDFLNNAGQDDAARNPNAGIRLRPPGG